MEGIKLMTRAFIWDLDGTLLDSYEAILDGIAETYRLLRLWTLTGKRSMLLFFTICPVSA